MTSYKERLYKLYDEYDLLDSNDGRKEPLKGEILDIVESLDSPDDKDYHIAGLVIYFSDQKAHSDLAQAHEYFKKSVELNSDYAIARLYSAHCYHDTGKYEEALHEYLEVDGQQIKNEFALWRYVKLIEQIGFCYHKTGKLSEAYSYFEKVLWYYQRADFDDLVDAIELFQCLKDDDPIAIKIKEIENTYYHKSNS